MLLTESLQHASYFRCVQRGQSIGSELLWLGIFLSIFAIVTAIVLRFAFGHHFNDRIAVMLSAIVSGLAVIALRARFIRHDTRRP